MPSSPNYKRDYAQETKTSKARGEYDKTLARNRARRAMITEGEAARNDGRDVGHIKALGRGGANTRDNMEMQSAKANRSFARNADGSMKSETSKKERK